MTISTILMLVANNTVSKQQQVRRLYYCNFGNNRSTISTLTTHLARRIRPNNTKSDSYSYYDYYSTPTQQQQQQKQQQHQPPTTLLSTNAHNHHNHYSVVASYPTAIRTIPVLLSSSLSAFTSSSPFSSSSSSSSSSLNNPRNKHAGVTKQLLEGNELRLGSFDLETWYDMERLLLYEYCSFDKESTIDSVHKSLQLLQRMLAEQNYYYENIANEAISPNDRSMLPSLLELANKLLYNTDILVRILDSCVEVNYFSEGKHDDTMDGGEINPLQVLQMIQSYGKHYFNFHSNNIEENNNNNGTEVNDHPYFVPEKAVRLLLEATIPCGQNYVIGGIDGISGSDELEKHLQEREEMTLQVFADRCLETCIAFYQMMGSNFMDQRQPDADLFDAVMKAWVMSYTSNAHITTINKDIYLAENRSGSSTISKFDLITTKVERVTDLMKQLNVRWSTNTYNVVIKAWAKTGSFKGADRAQRTLQEMYAQYKEGDTSIRLKPHNFSTVIAAWARTKDKDAGTYAEDIFQTYRLLREQNDIDLYRVKAKEIEMIGLRTHDDEEGIVNAMIQCYMYSATRFAANRAHELFQELKERLSIRNAHPHVALYLSLIRCWAATGDVVQVERLFAEVKETSHRFSAGTQQRSKYEQEDEKEDDLYGDDDDDGVRNRFAQRSITTSKTPIETDLYQAVMTAWSKSERVDKVERAEMLLRECTENNIFIDLPVYNAYLSVLAGSKHGFPNQKATNLMYELKERAANGETHLRPNQITYTLVIKAWSRTGHGDRAADILEDMYKDYLAGNVSAKPSVQSFNAVLAAFGRSKDFGAPQRAVEFFELMKSLANDETLNIRVDTYTYGSLISSLASSKDNRAEAATKAEHYLREMIQKYEEGDNYVRPDTVAYNSVMNGWARADNPERAQALLKEMYQEYKVKGNEHVKPNAASFNTAIKAWAYVGAIERAEALLHKMIELSETGGFDAPNARTYTTMIMGYGICQQPGAPQLADKVFQTMIDLYKRGKLEEPPQKVTYQVLRKTWYDSNERIKERRIAEIEHEMGEKFGYRRRD